MANNKQILFICTGNTGRSPMAETIANHYLNYSHNGYEVISRGVRVNPQQTAAEENAVVVMKTLNINLSSHHATQISKQDIQASQLILTMTETQKETVISLEPEATSKIFTLNECAYGQNSDISDAYGKDLAFYTKTRDEITKALEAIQTHHYQCVTTK